VTAQPSYPVVRPAETDGPTPFGFRGGARPVTALTDQTRRLCCAPYVDGEFANKVIAELVEDEHRAVAPSFGFDLDPVVRHCYRARRLLLLRNTLLTGVVVAGLGFAPKWTFILLAAGLLAQFIRLLRRRRPARQPRGYLPVLLNYVLGWLPFLVIGGLFLAQGWFRRAETAGRAWVDDLAVDDMSRDAVWDAVRRVGRDAWDLLAAPVAVSLLALFVLTAYNVIVYRALTSGLARRDQPVPPRLPNARVARRVARVAAAQYGNVMVHAADPFLGTGEVTRAWSFALNLRRRSTTGPGQPVALDPLDVNRELRRRLGGLGDEDLPERERIPGICLVPHVVADGLRDLDDELVCPRDRLPYPYASPTAIDAIIRHPQGGLRYFQRVVVGHVAAGDDGHTVRAADGRTVSRLRHQEVLVSAFVHVAVEGGLLYAEFVATVLPPVQQRYHLLDTLHHANGRHLSRALSEATRSLFDDTVAAPWRLARGLWRVCTGRARMNRADRASREFRRYDYGARVSVRTLAAEPEPATYLQKLDAEKYVKLIERVTTEALLDYLDRHGVDTAEFTRRVDVIQDNSIHISGNTFTSSVAIGVTGDVTQLRT
jgi:hypothetical protein